MWRGRRPSERRVAIRTFDQLDLPSAVADQLARLERDAWPAEAAQSEAAQSEAAWLHDPALNPKILAVVQADEVLASVVLLHKRVHHAGGTFFAVGLSALTTRADVRRHGYGHALAAAAHAHIAASSADLGIFTCDRPLQTFYQRAGWQHLPGTVLVGGSATAPFRSDRPEFDKVTMGDFFSVFGRAHQTAFFGADIEIFPGEIDRLW